MVKPQPAGGDLGGGLRLANVVEKATVPVDLVREGPLAPIMLRVMAAVMGGESEDRSLRAKAAWRLRKEREGRKAPEPVSRAAKGRG